MENHEKWNVGQLLKKNAWAKVAEILAVFMVALIALLLIKPEEGAHPLYNLLGVWVANLFMLLVIWTGLKLRGEKASHFGLTFGPIRWKEALRFFLLSLLVFILALAGFILGSIIMANITGILESADMSGYDYMKDNLPMLVLSLIGVFIISSFGEEVIYRAFLIRRITEFGFSPKTGKILAVVSSSIIFGLIHYQWGPMGMVQTGFMGLVLGICYIKLNYRLWILILAHAYMDTILLVQMYFNG